MPTYKAPVDDVLFIANDVLQLFVLDPPAGTYSMVRHHALMLAAATAWLGRDAKHAWGALHASAGMRYVRAQVRPLWDAIEAADILRGQRCFVRQPHFYCPPRPCASHQFAPSSPDSALAIAGDTDAQILALQIHARLN